MSARPTWRHMRMHNAIRLGVAGFLMGASVLFGGSKLSRDLQNLPLNSTVDVIVQFTAPLSSAALNSVVAAGGKLKLQLPRIKAAVFTLPAVALQGIEHNPNVKYASPDRKLQGHLEFAEPTTKANIALNAGFDGTGVGVAVIDSGVMASHPDLQQAGSSMTSRVIYSQSFVDGDASGNDGYGHGTHVSGIVAGNGSASSTGHVIFTFRRIAPNANIINLRVLDANGQGADSAVVNAISQAIQLERKSTRLN